jgi:hypothetical protein
MGKKLTKTFRLSIYTPNKFRTEPELFTLKFVPSIGEKIHDFF